MQRITMLLEKINELNQKGDHKAIDIDLMLDYTRVIYADLLEWRNKLGFIEPLARAEAEPVAKIEESHSNQAGPSSAERPAVELDINISGYEATTQETVAPSSEPAVPVQDTAPVFSAPFYPKADIRETIGINDKYQFISELFGNDKDAYEEVINEINSFESEEAALGWLNSSVFDQYRWSEDSGAVQSFYRMLSDFFTAR